MNRNEFNPANRDSRRLSESALTWGAVILALGYLWFRLINNLWPEWTTNPQYGYGLLVPFLCIGLLVRRWEKKQKAESGNEKAETLKAEKLKAEDKRGKAESGKQKFGNGRQRQVTARWSPSRAIRNPQSAIRNRATARQSLALPSRAIPNPPSAIRNRATARRSLALPCGGAGGGGGQGGGDGGFAGAGEGVRQMPAFGEVPADGGLRDGGYSGAADVCGGSAGNGRRRAGGAVCGSGRAIVDTHHQGDGLHAGDGLYRQHFEVPARHAGADFRQPQTDAGGNGNLHAVAAGAD